MPLTSSQIRGALTTSPWTKDFLHLQPFPLTYLKRFSFEDIVVKAVKPKDRIKYWNVVPGDRVRIIGDKDGKVLEVAKINKLSNRVYLKGATAKVRHVHVYSYATLFKRCHPKADGALKNVHYSRCQLLIGEFEFPPRGKATEARTLPYVRPLFACSSYLSDISASLLPASAPRNLTGNLWVPAMNGNASQLERHQGCLGLVIPRAASKFPGRSGQNAQHMNVRRVLSHA